MHQTSGLHTFHIPVMGLGYTVDTPLKVAKFGISSVVSIMDDILLEDMRKIHSQKLNLPFEPISEEEEDYRAKRIQAYLDFLHTVIQSQLETLKSENWNKDGIMKELVALLPKENEIARLFDAYLLADHFEKCDLKSQILTLLTPGSIDVNIMTKVDKLNFDKEGIELPREYSDALSALRGFGKSKLEAAVVFSAGMNPALYSYVEQFSDFFPNEKGEIKKRIILKVSDYRSALIQGKFLAKKGLFVSEFRIESGLNCGGHAFATDGFLAGPILEDFKINREELIETIRQSCNQALLAKAQTPLANSESIKITYQGGIGTAGEDNFLRNYYHLDSTGWGSPFLLVPEATSVDDETLQRIIEAKKSDFYLSHASPLGIPFNNLRTSSGEKQRLERIEKGRPGSPCYKKFLAFSTEFTEKPICTASRQYQNLKVKLFNDGKVSRRELDEILEKDCLCEGLSAPAILAQGELPRRNLKAVTICPGPNLAYFKGIYSLKEMVDHIYGKITLTLDSDRPHVFVKEAQLYVDYLKKEFQKLIPEAPSKQEAYLEKFRRNLDIGLTYYQNLVNSIKMDSEEILEKMKVQLEELKAELEQLKPVLS
ncbi:hypothetical protein SAMN03080617_03775 [Algoriphagus alkaliphilus]|uniref:Uncharacterized protein n=1 Tax=Algoriphagus alkaliphilus TaxID=279824 RepID=A0A1G5ZFK3_9BACT|nr:hypothetical protein [Algoriphagus alkaliphilus]MBA4298857.1 hypothetical protein [Cyclobacterium sp.]SDA93699.1 hypothetical protein SAMN03080617_03775 [Algoriphagus alkaliphilus]